MKISFTPLGDRVAIERTEVATKTAAGLELPSSSEREKPQEGIIVAVGKGAKGEEMTVKVGDEVIFHKYAGSDMNYKGKPYLIMREGDIFGIN